MHGQRRRTNSGYSMGDSPTKHLVIPSQLDQMLPVQRQILAEAEAAGFGSQALFAIRLALDEALANAVKHGNKLDAAKTVTVDYTVTPQRVDITICDQGTGFKPDDLCDPTHEDNLSRPHGRGVMLMRAYMTEVTFNDTGNCVHLAKDRDCCLPTVK